MIKANYHTHLAYCNHAVGYSEDYVKEAIKNNFEILGITDHAPINDDFMTKEEYENNWCHQNMKLKNIPIYLDDVAKAKEKYKNQIKVLVGFEAEFLPKQIDFYKFLREKVDYLNLGVHYFLDKNNKVINSYSGIDYTNVLEYARAAVLGMESGLFNTLVHPDLFMFDYKNINGERKFDEAAIKASRIIIEAAIKNDVYLEVNANGLKNSVIFGKDPNNWLYPYHEFWELVKKDYCNAHIIIGADAHDPLHLANENVKSVIEFSNKLGLIIDDYMEIKH